MSEVQDALIGALSAVEGLRVLPYWADSVAPPVAVLDWPVSGSYDSTMARGMDELTLPISVFVGRADARASLANLSAYLDGSGERSIKEALESYQSPAWDVIHVSAWEVKAVEVAGTNLLAAVFTVSIHGKGKSQ